jgi:hypothetical protein
VQLTIASALIGKMVKTSPLPQIGMKVLNTLIVNSMALIQVMVVVLKVIKVNSLNLSLVEVNIAKEAAAVNHVKV